MLINIKMVRGAQSPLGLFAQLPQRGYFAQLPLGFSASLLLNLRKGLNASLLLMPQGHFFGQVLNNTSFLLPEQKKRNKENSPSALFVLLRQVFPLNKKNSLTLKQLFVFNAPTLTSASRPKSEAGPFRFFSQHRFARWGVMFSFFCFVCWGECL